jgi:hypothetical protein
MLLSLGCGCGTCSDKNEILISYGTASHGHHLTDSRAKKEGCRIALGRALGQDVVARRCLRPRGGGASLASVAAPESEWSGFVAAEACGAGVHITGAGSRRPHGGAATGLWWPGRAVFGSLDSDPRR